VIRSPLRFLLPALLAGGCSYTTNQFILGGSDVPATPDIVVAPDVVTAPDVVAAPDVVTENDVVMETDVVTAPDVIAVDGGEADAGDVPVIVDAAADAVDVPQVIFCAGSRPCPMGLVCDDGICAPMCPMGKTACGGFCRVTQTDTANCGGCGMACMPGQECRAGMCSTVCTSPTTNCSNVCRDLSSDNAHCGMCARACTGGTSCVMGACVCPSGQTACAGTCTNITSDPANCGTCGNRCATGQVCAAGTCVVNCTAGLTNCAGTCRNLQTDTAACGRCDVRCAAPVGGTVDCAAGACVQACPRGRTLCNGVCVDLTSDSANCGRCANACPLRIGICSSGTCCILGQTACNGACTSLSTDNNNCGRCGNVCSAGFTCRVGNCEANLRIASLGVTNARVVDHNAITGDDRGGIAANVSYVHYSGDTATARFFSFDLSSPAVSATPPRDAFFSNLRSGAFYSLSTDGVNPASQTIGGMVVTFTHLLELNAMTLAPTGVRVALTQPVAFDRTAYYFGIFAGYDRVVLYVGGRAYNIALPGGAPVAGTVSDLGAVALNAPFYCENWAFWGVAEFFGNAIWLSYRTNGPLGANAIVRTRVPDGNTQVITNLTNLSDMCSFTVVPARTRWYFHHEGGSQFTTTLPLASEVIGYADATFTFTN